MSDRLRRMRCTAVDRSGSRVVSRMVLPSRCGTIGKKRLNAGFAERMRPSWSTVSTPSFSPLKSASSWAFCSRTVLIWEDISAAMAFTASARGANSLPRSTSRRWSYAPRPISETREIIFLMDDKMPRVSRMLRTNEAARQAMRMAMNRTLSVSRRS